MSDFSLGALLRKYDREISKMYARAFGNEQRKVPQRVKTKVRKRAGGRCEYPRCRKRPREFHHWKDPATERTTAFLCHKHHVEKGHVWKKTDAFGILQPPRMVGRRSISVPKRTRRKTRKTRRK